MQLRKKKKRGLTSLSAHRAKNALNLLRQNMQSSGIFIPLYNNKPVQNT
jgi:hypothetical protein